MGQGNIREASFQLLNCNVLVGVCCLLVHARFEVQFQKGVFYLCSICPCNVVLGGFDERG